MLQKGRPKDIKKAKNRVHQIIFSEMAERMFREISTKRGNKSWIHDWISKKLIETFKKDNQYKYLLDNFLQAQKDMHKAQEKCEDARKLFVEEKMKKNELETKAKKK